jgi:hypothetical protein
MLTQHLTRMFLQARGLPLLRRPSPLQQPTAFLECVAAAAAASAVLVMAEATLLPTVAPTKSKTRRGSCSLGGWGGAAPEMRLTSASVAVDPTPARPIRFT